MECIQVNSLCGRLRLILAGRSYSLPPPLVPRRAAHFATHRQPVQVTDLMQGLRSGILVLIVPPMFMSVGITVLAYRKRNRTNNLRESEKSQNDW